MRAQSLWRGPVLTTPSLKGPPPDATTLRVCIQCVHLGTQTPRPQHERPHESSSHTRVTWARKQTVPGRNSSADSGSRHGVMTLCHLGLPTMVSGSSCAKGTHDRMTPAVPGRVGLNLLCPAWMGTEGWGSSQMAIFCAASRGGGLT